jgi:hypothetical protein
MKSDLQIKREVEEDLESLRNGTAQYSTPAQDAIILLAALVEVVLIGWAFW